MSDDTDSKQPAAHLFKPGVSGNPKGRPKGSRSKLGEAFLADLQTDWAQHGVATLEKVRETKPEVYVKVVASILPQELNVNHDVLGDMSTEELEQYADVLKSIVDRAKDSDGAFEGNTVGTETTQ